MYESSPDRYEYLVQMKMLERQFWPSDSAHADLRSDLEKKIDSATKVLFVNLKEVLIFPDSMPVVVDSTKC